MEWPSLTHGGKRSCPLGGFLLWVADVSSPQWQALIFLHCVGRCSYPLVAGVLTPWWQVFLPPGGKRSCPLGGFLLWVAGVSSPQWQALIFLHCVGRCSYPLVAGVLTPWWQVFLPPGGKCSYPLLAGFCPQS